MTGGFLLRDFVRSGRLRGLDLAGLGRASFLGAVGLSELGGSRVLACFGGFGDLVDLTLVFVFEFGESAVVGISGW